MKCILFFICYLIGAAYLYGQSAHKLLRQGDRAYNGDDLTLAEESYRKALEKRRSFKGAFNLGNSVYRQDRFDEAAQLFGNVVEGTDSNIEKAQAQYNQGNALLKSGKGDEAIASYKRALEANPNDPDILKNLYIAKMMQQQQRQQQNQQDKKQDNSQQQDEHQEESQQQNQDQQNGQDSRQPSDVNSEGQREGEAPQNQDLSKEDALKLLQVIENEEKNVQEKLRKTSGKKNKPKKDW